MGSRREKTIIIKVPYEVYLRLFERSRVEGYSLLSDYVKAIIYRELGLETTPSRIERIEKKVSELEERMEGIDVDKIANRLARRIHDMVNPISAEITRLQSRIADIIERIDGIEDRLGKLEQRVNQFIEHPPHREVTRKRGIDRLREEGVLFESELKRLRDRDRFFAYLEREGAKVIEAAGERIAVYPDFWEDFKKKLFEEIDTSNEDIIRKVLTETEYRLFQKLFNSGLIYYDSIDKKWKPVTRELLN